MTDRDRVSDLADALWRRPSPAVETPARFVGRVEDGGAKPTTPERFHLVQPLSIAGDEAEGEGAAFEAQGDLVPVLIIGSKSPPVGAKVLAHFVPYAWVAEYAEPAPTTVDCGGCGFPRRNLTLSWANDFIGNGSAVMTFDGADSWDVGCTNGLTFRLSCAGGAVVFAATRYTGGSCPSGTPSACSSAGSNPDRLTLTSSSCSPPSLRYAATIASCPGLLAMGYTQFVVTI